jgi:hypothetical protein
MRMRDTSAPILLVLMAAVCVLLTPSADAGYAVITFGGIKPIMSAGTSLVAAGVVLSLVMFPIYVLALGAGCSRDRRLGTGATLASAPIPPGALLAGRTLANASIVVLFSVVALALVAAAIASRTHSAPDLFAVAVYLLIVVPCGLCALPLGVLLDRYLGDHDSAKAMATIALWSALMVCAITASPDLFGLAFLRENAPEASAGANLSVGIVVSQNMARAPWTTLNVTPGFVASRFELIAAALIGSAIVCMTAARGLLQTLSRGYGSSRAASAEPTWVPTAPARFRPTRSGAVRSALLMSRRWFHGAKWTGAFFAVGLCAAVIAPRSPRLALGAAMLVPLSIVNARRISGEAGTRAFESTTAAFWRPSPLLFTALTLALLTAIPVVPVLLQAPFVRGIYWLVTIVAGASWLTWTCAAIGRPLLGISVYALVWYVESFF